MNENEVALCASATGILQCLKLLAAEAASLKLLRTLSAIEDALEMAASESGIEVDDEEFDEELEDTPPARLVLH